MDRILSKIDDIKKYIGDYKLEISTGTKKMIKDFHKNAVNDRNSFVQNKTTEYGDMSLKVKAELDKRLNEMMPKDKHINYNSLDNKNTNIRKVLEFNNVCASLTEKLNFNFLLTTLDRTESGHLTKINTLIKNLLKVFDDAKIRLTADDFKYSFYTHKYMLVYLEYSGKEDFNTKIKEVFDDVYWSCPQLITHIRLNFKSLINKYNKELKLFTKDKKDRLYAINNIKTDNPKDVYRYNIDSIYKMKNADEYTLALPFIDGSISASDYLKNSPTRKNTFNKFIGGAEFTDLSGFERENYYANIFTLRDVIAEYENYIYFKLFLEDVIKRYKNKDTYKNVTKNKMKEISKEESIRSKTVSNILPKKTLFGVKDNTNNEKLLLEQNEHIKKLNTLYSELDEDQINDLVVSTLNDTSTISNAFNVCAANYNYFSKLFDILLKDDDTLDKDAIYNRFLNFIYDPNKSFTNKINMLTNDDVTEIIYNKYQLLKFALTKEDFTDNLDTLKSNTDFVIRTFNIENNTLTFENLDLINQIKKLG